MTMKGEGILGTFERNMLRSIFRGIQENSVWCRRFNIELYQTYKEPDVVHFTKLSHLNWVGHVIRINNNSILKEIFAARPVTTRGRPKLR